MWNVKSFDIVDARMRRPAPEMRLERLECRLRAFRNYFNRSIGKVADIPAEGELLRFAHDKPPEPHTLNAPPDNPAAEAHFGRRRRTT
jgi:hypothetical protein